MLKFYYNPLSPIARRVWLTLLEKKIPFEPVVLKLTGDQFHPEYLSIHPFHHVPAIVDNGLRLVESLAILDYLNAKYPTPPLLPTPPEDIAIARMAQLVTANELLPNMMPLIYANPEESAWQKSQAKFEVALPFMAELLGDRPYFGASTLTLGDIVAGCVIPTLPHLGLSLDPYPNLKEWCDRILQRDAWQKTQMNSEGWEAFKRRIQIMAKRRFKAQKQA